MLSEGDPAPDFELPDQHGVTVSLADLQGTTTVLYFYPRANTPGCTKQACSVRDRASDYEAAGVRVIGISPDPVKRVAAFADKHSLGFTLLADADHTAAEAFGVWGEKSLYGKRYWGVARATFVIGPDGRIARAFPKVSPKTHDDVVLAALTEVSLTARRRGTR